MNNSQEEICSDSMVPNVDDTMFTIAMFPHLKEPRGIQGTCNLNKLRQFFEQRQLRAQKEGCLFTFARYEDSDVRRGAKIESISGLVVDVDNDKVSAGLSLKPTWPADYDTKLSGYCYGWYTTHSHQSTLPKFRLWIPLSRPLIPEEFKRAHLGLMSLLGHDPNIDPTCGEITRAYFTPSCDVSTAAIAMSEFTTGRLIAPEELFTANPVRIVGSGNEVTAPVNFATGRNDHLKKIATAMLHRLAPIDDIVGVLLAEDSRHAPPLFNDATEGFDADAYTGAITFIARILKSINRSRISNQQSPLICPPSRSASVPFGSPEERLEIVKVGDLRTAKLAPPEFLMQGLIPRSEVTMLSAHGGAGKTLFALILAAHVAAGRAWAGLEVVQGRVAFLSLEDPKDILLYRLKLIVEQYGLDFDMVGKYLRVIDGSDTDGTLVTNVSDHGTTRLATTGIFDQFRESVESADFIIVDNATDAYDGNENERRSVRSFFRTLIRIARANNAGFLLLAHIDKAAATKGADGNNYSGSTGWHAKARSRLFLKSTDEGVELVHEKSNRGKKLSPIALRWTEGGVLIVDGGEGRGDSYSLHAAADEVAVLSALEAAIRNGIDVSTARSGPNNTHLILAGLKELPSALKRASGRVRFNQAVFQLLQTGRIVVETYRDDSRKTKKKYITVKDSSLCGFPPTPPAH